MRVKRLPQRLGIFLNIFFFKLSHYAEGVFTFIYPVVWWTVGVPQMILQPAASMPLTSQLFSWRRTASCPSILGCCPPISSSVCLFFSLLALCPAGLSWQVLQILLHARTISVCVSLLWSRRLRGAQWLAEFCFAPLRWRYGLCR